MQKFTRIAALLLVVVAIVLAIAAFALGRRTSRQAEVPATAAATIQPAAAQGNGAQQQGVAVVVAAAPLPAGTPIAASALRVANLAQRPADSFNAVDAAVGGIPLLDIPAGTVLTTRLLAHGVSMALKPGERAMAVPVDEQAGAGNRVVPGDYVDVFLSLKAAAQATPFGKPATDATQTRLLLSRLRVLAYGAQDLPSQPRSATTNAEAGDKAKDTAQQASRNADQESRATPRTAVLAVPVEDADRLLLGVQNGKLSLAVRHPSDDGRPDDTLFPQPRTVLSPRNDLSADQKALLDRPDNRAYAGIDGLGLAGAGHAAPKPGNRLRRSAVPAVEIIRGASDDRARTGRTSSP